MTISVPTFDLIFSLSLLLRDLNYGIISIYALCLPSLSSLEGSDGHHSQSIVSFQNSSFTGKRLTPSFPLQSPLSSPFGVVRSVLLLFLRVSLSVPRTPVSHPLFRPRLRIPRRRSKESLYPPLQLSVPPLHHTKPLDFSVLSETFRRDPLRSSMIISCLFSVKVSSLVFKNTP